MKKKADSFYNWKYSEDENSTKNDKKVEKFSYRKFKGTAAIRYGQVKEERPKEQYQIFQQEHGHPGLKVDCFGLFVSFEKQQHPMDL